jgi:hypothetical protein
LRIPAQILSVLLHPILIILYVWMILMAIDPFLFKLGDKNAKIIFLTYTFVSTLVIPVLSIFIMKMLGFVKSFEMKDSKERIGPLIVIGTLYLWMFINYKNDPGIPPVFVTFILGSVFSIFIAFFINNFSKISLHMVGMGGFFTALLLMKFLINYDSFFISVFNWFSAQVSLSFVLIVIALLSGLVGSARLYLKAHETKDLITGFIVGVAAQIIAYIIIY